MSIALDNVSFSYGAAGAGVQDVSLTIGDGELMAVIGPSGCGKSTLLKLIAGFLLPSSGRISIGGRDMGETPPRLRDLGIVFQSYALFPHMTIAENVGYPLKLRGVNGGERQTRVRESLALVGLEHLADRTPRSLSGGQQQRVALARALVFRPRALLLDEPLSALDAALRGEMRDEIRRLQQHHGIATLHITHDQEEALSMADRVAVMGQGRILQVGTPREIYAEPGSHAVAAFVGHANLLPGTVAAPNVIDTPVGRLAGATHGFAPGDRVSVLIRPEAIRPAATADRPNAVRVTIVRDRFLGSLRRLDAVTESGVVLLVETDPAGEPPAHVELPPDAVRVIAPDPQGPGKRPDVSL